MSKKSFHDLVHKECNDVLEQHYKNLEIEAENLFREPSIVPAKVEGLTKYLPVSGTKSFTLAAPDGVRGYKGLNKYAPFVIKYKGKRPTSKYAHLADAAAYVHAHGTKPDAVQVNPDYVTLMPDVWEMSAKATEELAPFMPTVRDLTMEFARAVRCEGVEYVHLKSHASNINVEKNGTETGYKTSKLYAKVLIDRECVTAKDVDKIRGEFLRAAVFLGRTVRDYAQNYAVFQNTIPGPMPVSVHAPELHIVKAYGGEPYAAYDHMTDSIAVRLMVRYVITPA